MTASTSSKSLVKDLEKQKASTLCLYARNPAMAPSHSAQEHSSAWCKQLHVDSCPLPVQRVVEQQLPTLFHSNAGHWHIDACAQRPRTHSKADTSPKRMIM